MTTTEHLAWFNQEIETYRTISNNKTLDTDVRSHAYGKMSALIEARSHAMSIAAELSQVPAASPVMEEKPEGVIPKMSDQLAAESDIAALEYGRLCDRFIGERSYDSSHIVEAHECGQTWMYRKLTAPAPPIEPGEQKSFAEIKGALGSIFYQHIAMNESGTAIEGNPAVHRMAEWVHGQLRKDKPLEGDMLGVLNKTSERLFDRTDSKGLTGEQKSEILEDK